MKPNNVWLQWNVALKQNRTDWLAMMVWENEREDFNIGEYNYRRNKFKRMLLGEFDKWL